MQMDSWCRNECIFLQETQSDKTLLALGYNYYYYSPLE